MAGCGRGGWRHGSSTPPLSIIAAESAQQLLRAARAASTWRGHRRGTRLFQQFLEGRRDASPTRLPTSDAEMVEFVVDAYERGATYAAARQAVVALRTMGTIAFEPGGAPYQVGDLHRGELLHLMLEGFRRSRPRSTRGQALPFRMDQVRAALRRAAETGALEDLAAASALYLGMIAMVRMGDLTRGVVRGSCAVGEDRVAFLLQRSKTDQAGRGERKVVPRTLEGEDAGTVVRRWMEGVDIWFGRTLQHDDLLFPHLAKARVAGGGWALQVTRGAPWSPRSATTYIHRLLEAAGAPADARQTGHGARRGGAQELWRRGVQVADIAVAGGWARDSQVLPRTYLGLSDAPRRNPEEAAEAVRRAWESSGTATVDRPSERRELAATERERGSLGGGSAGRGAREGD